MYALFTYGSILVGPDSIDIDHILKLMRKAKLDITDEWNLEDFLGVNVGRKYNGTIHLTQLHLIENILQDLNLLGEGSNIKTNLVSPSQILKRHTNVEDFDNSLL